MAFFKHLYLLLFLSINSIKINKETHYKTKNTKYLNFFFFIYILFLKNFCNLTNTCRSFWYIQENIVKLRKESDKNFKDEASDKKDNKIFFKYK